MVTDSRLMGRRSVFDYSLEHEHLNLSIGSCGQGHFASMLASSS